MTKPWPKFVTKDLGESDKDMREMDRRWHQYDKEMRALISKGGLHLDEDSWWVHTETGELVGPDPDIERPLTEAELRVMPVRRGRPPIPEKLRKRRVNLTLAPDVIEALKARGAMSTEADKILREALGL